ncbi:FmdE, molybdenum formylmethanofuran dehydrogenase operon [Peptococcaceae bacterium CEB3]|nr:FmdE, molybdenum formylmethanofuran dehydrogenase operon [Peptococcaceae bacterium CEB3]
MRPLSDDLAAAEAFHGHLCSGMIIGVRMARLALGWLGIEDPASYRDLVVYVEMDRCAADAVSVVSGCTLGHRRLKWMDYGKMAATFLDLATRRAIRVAAVGEHSPASGVNLKEFWQGVSDDDLFRTESVSVPLSPFDLPGRPLRTARCDKCGEKVLDGREVERSGQVLCRACASGSYYVSQAGRKEENDGVGAV